MMRYLLAAAAIAGLLIGPVHADTMKNCGAAWKAMSQTHQAKYGTYLGYSKTCLAKDFSTGMASGGPVPAGATGMCKDGTYTMAKTHQGACSGHGGIGAWY